MVRNYNITFYYLIVLGLRAALFWYAVDPHIFLSVEVGSIILAIAATRLFYQKKESYFEWGKQLVEVIFYAQLVLAVARLSAVVYSQPTPSLWVCTTILVLLFEAALCLDKILVYITAADGILWENFGAPIDKIRRLVSPDYIPAFQGGEELAQEKQPEVPKANVVAMVPLWPVRQGGLPSGSGLVGPQGGPFWAQEEIVRSLEGDITIPRVPMSGILPSTIAINDFMQYPRAPEYYNFPAPTVPNQGFIPGGFLFGDMNLNEVPNTPYRSLLNLNYPDRMQILDQIRTHNPYLVNHLSNGRELYLKHPKYIVNLTNLAGTKGGFYLRLDFHRQIHFPSYYPANDLEMVNGDCYKWINMSLYDLKNYLENDRNFRHFANRLILRRDMGSYIYYGGSGFRRAEHLFDLQPYIPGVCVNGMPFCWFPRN